jgi:phage-related protein (TIGR01555 family)
MQITAEPRLALPSRAAQSAAVSELRRAGDLLGEFRRELAEIKLDVSRMNSTGLAGLFDGLGYGAGATAGYNQDTATQPYTLANANAYVPISLNRILLNYTYMTNGLIRTLVDQPVEDAFRGGLKFKSAELDEEELKKLNRTFKRKRSRAGAKITAITRANVNAGYDLSNSDQEGVKATAKWARLFGGAGLIINTDQNFTAELNVDAIKEDSPLEFIPADRWELILQQMNIFDQTSPTPFNYYGLPLHRSRVAIMNWAEAPSYIRLRLQGWGMSILEESIRAVNSYLKFEKLLFELLDEAKIDVYKIKGFNTALASPRGTELIQRRIALGNQAKNFQSALTMDMEDDYAQKQLTFSGIAEIYEQLRTNLCAYLKFPKNKLFGESAGGFGSGKDSLDNYNSTVGIVREQIEPQALMVGELRCQQLFGMVPEDLEVEWAPLDVLDGVEQETVKTAKQTRIVEQFTSGLLSGEEACQSLQKEGLLLVECEVLLGLRDVEPPMTENPDQADAAADRAIKVAKAKPQPPQNGGRP